MLLHNTKVPNVLDIHHF